MNEHSRAFGIVDQSGLPVCEICGEEINRESCAFGGAPSHGHRPEQSGAGGDPFAERSPLRVAHYAFAVTGTGSTELASGDQWRVRGAGISAASGHSISEVNAASFHPDQFFACAWRRLGNIADLQDFRSALTGDDDRFHS